MLSDVSRECRDSGFGKRNPVNEVTCPESVTIRETGNSRGALCATNFYDSICPQAGDALEI